MMVALVWPFYVMLLTMTRIMRLMQAHQNRVLSRLEGKARLIMSDRYHFETDSCSMSECLLNRDSAASRYPLNLLCVQSGNK